MNDYRPTAFSAEVTAILRGMIARFDINQVDLAQLCDVSQSQFSKIIRGVRPMTLDQLAVICGALGASVDEVVEQATEYTTNRSLFASPLVFVQDGDRLERPIEPPFAYLDKWAQSAYGRVDSVWGGRSPQTVGGQQEDYDLVANDSIDETRTDEDLY